jgi:hypothetical protein
LLLPVAIAVLLRVVYGESGPELPSRLLGGLLSRLRRPLSSSRIWRNDTVGGTGGHEATPILDGDALRIGERELETGAFSNECLARRATERRGRRPRGRATAHESPGTSTAPREPCVALPRTNVHVPRPTASPFPMPTHSTEGDVPRRHGSSEGEVGGGIRLARPTLPNRAESPAPLVCRPVAGPRLQDSYLRSRPRHRARRWGCRAGSARRR